MGYGRQSVSNRPIIHQPRRPCSSAPNSSFSLRHSPHSLPRCQFPSQNLARAPAAAATATRSAAGLEKYPGERRDVHLLLSDAYVRIKSLAKMEMRALSAMKLRWQLEHVVATFDDIHHLLCTFRLKTGLRPLRDCPLRQPTRSDIYPTFQCSYTSGERPATWGIV